MSKTLITILVCFIAGAGAGIGTGFAGMSAVAMISPLLITFLDIPAYTAVGIGLASDVLASLLSAYTYKKNGNLDIKNGLIMMAFVLLFTVIGSYLASFVDNVTMGNFSVIMTLILGIRFLVKPVMTTKEVRKTMSTKQQIIDSIIGGSIIGSICGFFGAGGGMMMLIVLTTFLHYELKTAVGTSVFIMSITALTGSISHFSLGEKPDILVLSLCMLFTLVFAYIASRIANKAQPKTLNRVTGIVLCLLSSVVIIVKYLI